MSRRIREGFTLVEILVVVSIIAVLVGMLAPALMNAFGTSKAAQCAYNLGQTGKALQSLANSKKVPRAEQIQTYYSDSDRYEVDEVFFAALGKTTESLVCPENLEANPSVTSFGFNVRLRQWGPRDPGVALAIDFGHPLVNPFTSDSVSEEDRDEIFGEDPPNGLLRARHAGRCNILFGDIHVELFDAAFVLAPEIIPDEITEHELEHLQEEFPSIDINNLTEEQEEHLLGDRMIQRWVFQRDRHFVDHHGEWTGSALPTELKTTTESASE